jgi:phosphohistidine phosphatase SixA
MIALRTLARSGALLAALLAGCASQVEQADVPTAIPQIPAATEPTPVPLPTAPPATPTATSTPAPSPTVPPSSPTAAPPTAVPATAVPPTTALAGPLAGPGLVDALRGGGYVIYFRHAATDQSQADTDLSRCETQRNLNEQGRADARAIGAAFRSLNIPVGQVLSSGYCRARDTAQLAFGRAELVRDLSGLPESQREQRVATLKRLLATPPEPGTNTVLVAHGFNIQAAAELSLAEGEAAIFAPASDGTFVLVARVRPDEWAALERGER